MAKTLVLGASLNRERYSNLIIGRLLRYGEEVVALGLKEGEVDGVSIDTSMVPYSNVDTVTLYLNPFRQKQYYEYICSLAPRRVIFNPGTENPEFYEILQENGITVSVACNLVLLSTNQY
ncbi:CoA-binding protein [Ascidiimonas aurantiaca]|uniref:CoA-binding protein n=1 Tax=Ascidiimonas aurantiaca TaxID=1685432 RepID=UPI0030ECD087